MQTLNPMEAEVASGGIAPALAVVLAAGTLYGAGKSAYEFGKALGRLLASSVDEHQTKN